VKPGKVSAVVPRPLDDDFDLAADAEDVLGLLHVHVVEDPASGQPALDEAEILITGIGTQNASANDLARAMPRLRWIHSMTAGIEDVLSHDLLERRILVTNGAGAYATAIAEYAFAAMVMLCRRIPELAVAHERHRWLESHPLGSELAGKRVGIVGYGGIGRALARLCAAAGMTVWGLRRKHAVEDEEGPAERVLEPGQLPELLAWSDFVVLAASLNPSSRGLLGSAQLEAMKPGAFLVNVSRGALVDEAALAPALTSGRLGGVLLDVTALEPLPETSELWGLPNLWTTPHIAGGTHESRGRALLVLLTNVRHYLAGRLEDMVNVVDLPHELGHQ
jgi:phosphoglycerate dehydrogenase-like enzyme